MLDKEYFDHVEGGRRAALQGLQEFCPARQEAVKQNQPYDLLSDRKSQAKNQIFASEKHS